MIVPGSNLLNQALRLIAKQSFQYYAFKSRAVNDIGQDVAQYATAVTIQGSVQAVPRDLFEAYGLDLQGNYLTFFIPKNLVDINRDVSGDQISFGCSRYQCLSKTNWFPMDGWISIIAVEIPA